jgi:hypothetical protein
MHDLTRFSISLKALFVVFSQKDGVISEHDTQADAARAFKAYLRSPSEHTGQSLPVILKRENDVWNVF